MKHYAFENAAVQLAGVDATREYLEPMFAGRNREMLVIAMCDDNLRLVRLLSIAGDSASVTVPVPEIMHVAVTNNCSGIVLAHNHPTGQLRPSPADIRLTKRFHMAAQLLSIQLLDHLIFNGAPAFSFRRQGLL